MKVILYCGTICVFICLLFLTIYADEAVPDVPQREVELDKDGNLIEKTNTESGSSKVFIMKYCLNINKKYFS